MSDQQRRRIQIVPSPVAVQTWPVRAYRRVARVMKHAFFWSIGAGILGFGIAFVLACFAIPFALIYFLIWK